MDLGGIDRRNIWCVGVLMSDNTCMHSFPALHVHIAELLYFSGICNSVQPEVESVRKKQNKQKIKLRAKHKGSERWMHTMLEAIRKLCQLFVLTWTVWTLLDIFWPLF